LTTTVYDSWNKVILFKNSSGRVCDSLIYQTGKCAYRSHVGFSVYSATGKADNLWCEEARHE